MRRWILRTCLYLAVALVALAILAVAFVFYQGRRTPDGVPIYVALGSSYAAGAGLGPLQPGSPLLCARTTAGYPSQLAAMLHLPMVDMSCGGAVTANVLEGGQFFQGAQIRVIDRRTRLVTITTGGNDVNFVGDMSMLALRRSGGISGWLAAHLWGGPRQDDQRDWPKLYRDLTALIAAIRRQAPDARIVVATYPTVLPPQGTCAQLNLAVAEADRMRAVEQRLAETTRRAARDGGAVLVDMNALGAAHDACSASPWTHGLSAFGAAPFHPTLAGAKATAAAIAAALKLSPAGVAAVR